MLFVLASAPSLSTSVLMSEVSTQEIYARWQELPYYTGREIKFGLPHLYKPPKKSESDSMASQRSSQKAVHCQHHALHVV